MSYLGDLPPDIDKQEPELTGVNQLYQRARELMSGPEGEVDKTLMTGLGTLGGVGSSFCHVSTSGACFTADDCGVVIADRGL